MSGCRERDLERSILQAEKHSTRIRFFPECDDTYVMYPMQHWRIHAPNKNSRMWFHMQRLILQQGYAPQLTLSFGKSIPIK